MKPYFILDPGHGAKQPGKRSPMLEDMRQFKEWESNWKVAYGLHAVLSDAGLHAELSLKMNPKRVGQMLSKRVDNINAITHGVNNDGFFPICISIHSNAFGNTWSSPSGIETYYFQNSHFGMNFAKIMQDCLVESIGFNDRGIKPNKTFTILKDTSCPTILTESGFYTNREEVEKMLDPSFVENSIQGHLNGCIQIMQDLNKYGNNF